jgi:hypothetical protein
MILISDDDSAVRSSLKLVLNRAEEERIKYLPHDFYSSAWNVENFIYICKVVLLLNGFIYDKHDFRT